MVPLASLGKVTLNDKSSSRIMSEISTVMLYSQLTTLKVKLPTASL